MPTITLTGINDGASSLLDAVDVEWHICLGAAGSQTECQYGTGTITAGELAITTTSDGYHEGTLGIVGSTELKPFAGTATSSATDAPVIVTIDALDSSAVVNYTHPGFGAGDGYYEFFSSGTSLSQFSTDASLPKTLPNLTNSVTYDITVKAFVDSGDGINYIASAASNMVQVTPVGTNVIPSFTTQPSNYTVSAGVSAYFNAVAAGTPSPTLQWQHDLGTGTWTNITSETSSQLVVTTSDTSKNGWQYRCVATNSEGSTNSNAATLTVTSASTGFVTIFSDNFDSYAVGTRLVDVGYGGGTDTVVDSEYSVSGTNSAKCSILAGETAFGEWGFFKPFNSSQYIRNGDTVRVSVDMYWPNTFNFSASPNFLKWFRLRRMSAALVHQGYWDLLIDVGANPDELVIAFEKLNVAENPWPAKPNRRITWTPPKGQWINCMFEVTAGTSPVDSGGTAKSAFYANGTKIGEVTDLKTLATASDVIINSWLWGYWNNGAPQTQSCWHDNYKVEVDRA